HRRRNGAARSDATSDARSFGTGDRHRARAFSRLYSDCISSRNHRPIVSAIRAHDRHLGHLFRVQRAHAESRAFRAVVAPAEEDQGYVFIQRPLPDASSLERTDQVCRKIEDFLSKTPGVQYTTSVIGFSLLSLAQNTYSAFFFVWFKPWGERTKPEEQYQAIKAHINKELAGLSEGIGFAFPPPAIPGVGTSGGFAFILEDRAGNDVSFLSQNLKTFLDAARKRPELTG